MFGTLIFIGALTGSAPAGGALAAPLNDYPPCSRTVTDSCIQLADAPAPEAEPAYAGVGGPFEPIDDAVEEHATATPAEATAETLNENPPQPD